jgi:hypothetical protein
MAKVHAPDAPCTYFASVWLCRGDSTPTHKHRVHLSDSIQTSATAYGGSLSFYNWAIENWAIEVFNKTP